MSDISISAETAANVLHFFGRGGFEAGGFTTKLMSAISNADQHNRFRLSLGFPELVAAMVMAMDDPDGIDKLARIERGD